MLFFEFKNKNKTKYIFFLRDKKKTKCFFTKKQNVDIPRCVGVWVWEEREKCNALDIMSTID